MLKFSVIVTKKLKEPPKRASLMEHKIYEQIFYLKRILKRLLIAVQIVIKIKFGQSVALAFKWLYILDTRLSHI